MHPPALTLKDFCDSYRVCRETAYQQIRAGRLRAVKLGRKTLILRADAGLRYSQVRDLFAKAQEVGFPGIGLQVGERHKPGQTPATAPADATQPHTEAPAPEAG